jgi:hypothetical protein
MLPELVTTDMIRSLTAKADSPRGQALAALCSKTVFSPCNSSIVPKRIYPLKSISTLNDIMPALFSFCCRIVSQKPEIQNP